MGPRWLTFSTNPVGVVSVSPSGLVTPLGVGIASVSATLGAVPVAGSLDVEVVALGAAPTDAAPTPGLSADAVRSVFSSHYTNIPVDTFNAAPNTSDLSDFTIASASRDVKRYFLRNYAIVEFFALDGPIDVATEGINSFRMSVWTPDVDDLIVKLVDFGADGAFGGGDDTEQVVTVPITAPEAWQVIEIPLMFGGGFGENLAQIVLDGQVPAGNTIFVDDILFYDNR